MAAAERAIEKNIPLLQGECNEETLNASLLLYASAVVSLCYLSLGIFLPSQKRQLSPYRRETRLQQVPSAAWIAAKGEREKRHFEPLKLLGMEVDCLLKEPQRAIAAIQPLTAAKGTAAVVRELQQATKTLCCGAKPVAASAAAATAIE